MCPALDESSQPSLQLPPYRFRSQASGGCRNRHATAIAQNSEWLCWPRWLPPQIKDTTVVRPVSAVFRAGPVTTRPLMRDCMALRKALRTEVPRERKFDASWPGSHMRGRCTPDASICYIQYRSRHIMLPPNGVRTATRPVSGQLRAKILMPVVRRRHEASNLSA